MKNQSTNSSKKPVALRLWKTAAAAIALCIAIAAPQDAKADVVLYDKDGTTFLHRGLMQGFYQYGFGDQTPEGGPVGGAAPVGGFADFFGAPTGNANDNSFAASRFRSGWTGSRFDWILTKQLTDCLKASAVLEIAYSISTHNNIIATNNLWDVRNAYLRLEGDFGTIDVGRGVGMYTLGSIISTATITSAALGFGNACSLNGDGLGCLTTGYGAKFPGFWAGFFYTLPNFVDGLFVKVAALDPVSFGGGETGNVNGVDVAASTLLDRTPLPNFQLLAMYDIKFGSTTVKPHIEAFWQRVGNDEAAAVPVEHNVTGVGLGVDIYVDDFLKLGANYCIESGTDLYAISATGLSVDGVGQLRDGTCLSINGRFTTGNLDITATYGFANVDPTDNDIASGINLFEQNTGIQAGLQYHMYDTIHWIAEFSNLKHEWMLGNTRTVNIVTLGASMTY